MRKVYTVYVETPEDDNTILVLAESWGEAEEFAKEVAWIEWGWDGDVIRTESYDVVTIYDKHSASGNFGCYMTENDNNELLVEI